MVDNILRVTFGKETRIKSKPLYQYDYGQKIKFIDLTLPAAYEVHFSNRERGKSTTVLATSNEVEIPDTYFVTGKDIYVWVYLHTGAADGETEYQIIIPITQRAKPSDEPPTPEEESVIPQTIAALNDAVTESRAGVQRVTQAESNVNNLYALTEDAKDRTYEYKEEAETAASLLTNVSAEAETLQPSQPATASYSSGVFSFGIPAGADGKDGKDGVDGKDGKDGKDAVVDPTLTIEGEAADAKVTGDILRELTSSVSGKQDAPSQLGTAGQVLGLDNNLNPKWITQSGGGGIPGTTNPKMDGTASPGSSLAFAREDHVHPTDTSRASQSDLNRAEANITNLRRDVDNIHIPTKVSQLQNDAGYLTEHQDLSDYALKSEIPTVTNDFTDAYKDKVDTLWSDYQSAIAALG